MNLLLNKEKKRIDIKFPYSPALVGAMRGLNARWDGKAKVWHMGLDLPSLDALRETFPHAYVAPEIKTWEHGFRLNQSANVTTKKMESMDGSASSGYVHKTKPYDHQRKALQLALRNKFFAFCMEMGCIDGETLILHPNGRQTPIKYLAGSEFDVCSFGDRGRLVSARAFAFEKGIADIYEVSLRDGKSILCTSDHVFLTAQGWKRLDDVRPGDAIVTLRDEFLIYPGSPNVDSGRLARALSDRSYAQKAQGLVESYLACCRHDDGQPRQPLNSGLFYLPLQAGVLEQFDAVSHGDGSAHKLSDIHPDQYAHRLSRKDYDDRLDSFCRGFYFSEENLKRSERKRHVGLLSSLRSNHDLQVAEYVSDSLESDYCINPFQLSRIKSIKFIKHGPYYDMHVPGYENYIGNGIVNHNTGKTKPIIDLIMMLKASGQFKRALIVAPLSVVGNWPNEARIHGDGLKVSLLVGDRQQRMEALKKEADIYVINYAGMRIMADHLEALKWDVMVCDESQNIKNRTAEQSKCCYKVGARSDRRYILTGTLVTNKPLDVFGQYKFLSDQILGGNYFAFQSRYAIMAQHGLARFPVKFVNLEELSNRLAPWNFRVLKKDCLDLPDKIYETRYAEFHPDAERIYKQLGRELATQLSNGLYVTAPIILTKLLRFSQITAGFVTTEMGETQEVGNREKIKVLLEILEEVSGKVVVWVRFKKEMEMVQQTLRDHGIDFVSLSGTDSQEDRQASIDRFQNVTSVRVFIGSIEAGGTGINLTAASTCVYLSNSYSLGTRLQSEDRLHRLGSKSNVTYVDVVIPGTIDDSVLKLLRQKKDLADIVNKDGHETESLLKSLCYEREMETGTEL